MFAFWNPAVCSSIYPPTPTTLVRTPLPGEGDTIVALSTAPGRSAIAVVRLSGPAASSVAEKVVQPWPLEPRRAVLCRISDPIERTPIDQSVVSFFPGPKSYTGEDTVEFSSHGGHAVPDALVGALLRSGAREALPGEFTRRAVLNGKLDLIQAEAIGDLIDATSESMRRLVLHQLDGGLSRQIADVRDRLLDLEALLAYDIDFPDEDHGPLNRTRISDAAEAVRNALKALLDTAPATELVRDGAIIVIAGRPNVGKSSLFNAIVGEMRAIVTDVPGTTRDAIESRVQFANWPARMVDTAGLRPTDELVERLGIEVSERYLANAHVTIACDDDSDRLRETIETIQSLSSAPIVPVLTKSDRGHAPSHLDDQRSSLLMPVRVSAVTRDGIETLASRIDALLSEQYGTIPTTRPALTRTRQRIAVQRAQDELEAFQQHWTSDALPASVAAVHIRAAVDALDELIGAVDADDVLGRVFATFCIGK
jgi:tRNA modification GTPase